MSDDAAKSWMMLLAKHVLPKFANGKWVYDAWSQTSIHHRQHLHASCAKKNTFFQCKYRTMKSEFVIERAISIHTAQLIGPHFVSVCKHIVKCTHTMWRCVALCNAAVITDGCWQTCCTVLLLTVAFADPEDVAAKIQRTPTLYVCVVCKCC